MLLVILNTLLEVGGPLGMLTTYLLDEIPAYMYPYVPYYSPYLLLSLLLPLPTTTPTPPLTYYYPYSTPYLLLSLLLPFPTTTPTPPLTYYSPGAWSEVTSMVTYVMMTNSLIHYCQSVKHIYMDTVYKLS